VEKPFISTSMEGLAGLLKCQEHVDCVGFEVLVAVGMKMAVFWVVAPCSMVEI
jgi:hypothetical protein